MEQTITSIIQSIESMNLVALCFFLFLSAVLQQVFPPFPSDTIFLVCGCIAAAGEVPWPLLYVCYVSGTVMSSVLLYDLGEKYGRRLILSKKRPKFLSKSLLLKTIACFQRMGIFTFIIGKFIAGINSIVLLIGGAVGYEKHKAYAGIIVAAVLQNTGNFLIGATMGSNIDGIIRLLYSLNSIGILLIVCVVLMGLGLFFYRRRKKNAAQ